MAHTKNIAEAIRKKLDSDADLAQLVDSDRLSINVSEEIHRLRIELGITQKELADRVGTHQSVIARLEDADYQGHSLKLLNRIAEASGKRLEVRFVEPYPAVEETVAFGNMQSPSCVMVVTSLPTANTNLVS